MPRRRHRRPSMPRLCTGFRRKAEHMFSKRESTVHAVMLHEHPAAWRGGALPERPEASEGSISDNADGRPKPLSRAGGLRLHRRVDPMLVPALQAIFCSHLGCLGPVPLCSAGAEHSRRQGLQPLDELDYLAERDEHQVHARPILRDLLQRNRRRDLRQLRHPDREYKRLGASGVSPCL